MVPVLRLINGWPYHCAKMAYTKQIKNFFVSDIPFLHDDNEDFKSLSQSVIELFLARAFFIAK